MTFTKVKPYQDYVICFIIGLAVCMLVDPFDLAIWRDRAYLMYMSQTIFRGNDLYESTPFGYTPLAPMVAGYIMQAIDWVFGNIDTVVISRVLGIVCYAGIVTTMYGLLKMIFKERKLAALGVFVFIGFNHLTHLSGINFEPKLLALLLQVLAIIMLTKSRWLLSGLFFSLAAMCWQPMVINCLAFVPYLIISKGLSKKLGMPFAHFSLGVLLGSLPCVLYLLSTDDWLYFWDQAVKRKVNYEGAKVFETPLKWIRVTLFTTFVNEFLFLFLGSLGLIKLLSKIKVYVTRRSLEVEDESGHIWLFVLLMVLFWSAFNFFEFQAALDFLPLLPVVVISGIYFIKPAFSKLNFIWRVGFYMIVLLYGTFDYFLSGTETSYSEQKKMITTLSENYGDPFAINFEEYYVVLEKEMPTKYMRYARFEDFIIYSNQDGCDVIADKIETMRPRVFINRSLSGGAASTGKCGRVLINSFTQDILDEITFRRISTRLFRQPSYVMRYDVRATIYFDDP